jgi:hypothetical protein
VPIVVRVLISWVLFAGVGFLIWWFAPHGPVLTGALVVYVLAAVGGTVWRILAAPQLSEPPRRDPRSPPSITPPSTS